MAVDLPTFRDHFPEFNPTPGALVLAKLSEAEATHSAQVWADPAIRDQGVMYKAAGLLALSPGAKCLRMADSNSPDSIYDKRWMELARSVSYGFRVL